MSKYTVRIELHNSTSAADAKLREEMAKRLFKQSLHFDEAEFDLPPAEYAIETTATADQVLNEAVAAARLTSCEASMLLTGPGGWLKENLPRTAPSAVRVADLILGGG